MRSRVIRHCTREGLRITIIAVTLLLAALPCAVTANDQPVFSLIISDIPKQIQNTYVDVDIQLTKEADSNLSRLDLAVAYDIEALSFAEATPGVLNTDCGWSYFRFSFGPVTNGRDSGRCGVIRLTIAPDYGELKPDCPAPEGIHTPITIARLRFLITNDRAYACHSLPVRFVWLQCWDNTIFSGDHSVFYQVASVHDTAGGPDIADFSALPSYTGGPDTCLTINGLNGVRGIDVSNGHVGTACADTIDSRGDINCNGVNYEIADYVMLFNYFLYGQTSFGSHWYKSLSNADINDDGTAAALDDFFCLAYRVFDQQYVCPDSAPLHHEYTYEDGKLGVTDLYLTYARIAVQGNVTPAWLPEDTTFSTTYYYDAAGDSTTILVCPFTTIQPSATGFTGTFLDLGGADILSVAMVTTTGRVVLPAMTGTDDDPPNSLPTAYTLLANYPNPFNPSTLIRYALPHAETVSLVVYNVLGQAVRTLENGRMRAGWHEVTWEGKDDHGDPVASGVYYYRLIAGSYQQTRSMVLLK